MRISITEETKSKVRLTVGFVLFAVLTVRLMITMGISRSPLIRWFGLIDVLYDKP